MSVKTDLDARLQGLPAHLKPTSIQMTEADWRELTAELDPLVVDLKYLHSKSYSGVPVEFVKHGGPHIHYTSRGRET